MHPVKGFGEFHYRTGKKELLLTGAIISTSVYQKSRMEGDEEGKKMGGVKRREEKKKS